MYKHDHITPFGDQSGTKKEQVASMFDQIATRYDFLNRFLSAGIDIGWRKKALSYLKNQPPKQLLDVATGTGDLAIMAHQMFGPSLERVEGIDISKGMLEIGRQKVSEKNLQHAIQLQEGDSEAINFAEHTFDAVTVGFGVRNFSNLEKGLQEILRVLKPGGLLVVLEFSKPKTPGIKTLYNLYTALIAPKAGRLIANNEKAYQYLNDSIRAFPEGNAFLDILKTMGYTNCFKKSLSLGICTVYTANKPG